MIENNKFYTVIKNSEGTQIVVSNYKLKEKIFEKVLYFINSDWDKDYLRHIFDMEFKNCFFPKYKPIDYENDQYIIMQDFDIDEEDGEMVKEFQLMCNLIREVIYESI